MKARASAQGAIFVGSPQQIIDKVHRYHRELGHEVMHLHADADGLTDVQHRDSLELFMSEIAPVLEATTLGAAYLAGRAVGTWADEDDVAGAWAPRQVIDPQVGDDERAVRRTRWLEARGRSEATIPELSALDF